MKKNIYKNKKWELFSNSILKRDNYTCSKCQRSRNQDENIVLQAHHEIYRSGKPWESALSDCITLCKGCHAREHNIIEPNRGWILLNINDLGDMEGVCERESCGSLIRYEHETYHPQYGYKVVGSTCIDFLTLEDKKISNKYLKYYKKISKFITESEWETCYSNNNKKYLESKYKHNLIKIYGENNYYSVQFGLKVLGEKWYDFTDFNKFKNKNLIQSKELSFLILLGKISKNENEKTLLRELYRNIK